MRRRSETIKRIMVGVDGSAASLDALRWAVRLRRRWRQGHRRQRLCPGHHRTLARLRQAAAWRSRAAADRLVRQRHPPGISRFPAGRRRPERPARRGCSGRRPPGRRHPGRRWLRPPPPGQRRPPFRPPYPGSLGHRSHQRRRPSGCRIVVGVDGSPGSAAALAFCAILAPLLATPVVAVYVDEPFVEWISESVSRSWLRSAEAEVRAVGFAHRRPRCPGDRRGGSRHSSDRRAAPGHRRRAGHLAVVGPGGSVVSAGCGSVVFRSSSCTTPGAAVVMVPQRPGSA